MKRSEIDKPADGARTCWEAHGWTLPPESRNDDEHDNFFAEPTVNRAKSIEEDEPANVRLVWERPSH